MIVDTFLWDAQSIQKLKIFKSLFDVVIAQKARKIWQMPIITVLKMQR